MQAEIITVGNELITGATVDTSSAWLSDRLGRSGVRVLRHASVGDDGEAIASAIREAAGRVGLIVVTGGLGPTPDDVTRAAVADVTGQPLEMDGQALASIEAKFASVGRRMAASNRIQALVPRGAAALQNRWGTAPGLRANVGAACLFLLPGVPSEMKAMFEQHVAPHVKQTSAGSELVFRAVHTFGSGESSVAEQIADLMAPGRNPAVGTTVREGIVTVRIVARAESGVHASNMAADVVQTIRSRLGPLVFGEDDDTMESLVGRALAGSQRTVATAESCTGGLIGKLLTDVAGSSTYYVGGYVTYSDRLKCSELEVSPSLIKVHGAVSEAVAMAMAEGCRRVAGSDYALSSTGIAGPGGGTASKPVGMVFVGVAGPAGTLTEAHHFAGWLGREAIRERTAITALDLLRRQLLEEFKK